MSLGAEIRRLRVLALAAAGEVSAKDASDAIGSNLGVTAYYVRDLAARKLLYVSRETRARGAVQTFYRITPEGSIYLAEGKDEMRAAVATL
jgi:hypothetical protein